MKTYIQLVIQNSDGEYLLQMRDGTEGIFNPLTWDFFGGAIDEDDASPAAACVRELEEELAITSKEGDFELLGEMIQHNGAPNSVFKYTKSVNWPLTVHEGAGAAFFNKSELERITLAKPSKQILETFL